MNTEVQTKERDAILVEDAGWIRVMGQPVLEALPSARAPYAQVDPFILVHEARGRLSPDFANTATKHLHRGFDNVLYMLEGRSAPATVPARAEPWKGRGCARAHS